jgi:hypothetical protein
MSTTVARLNGVFKYVFGDGPINVIPQYTKALKAFPFQSAKQLGRQYIFPVIVGDEQGATFNSDGSAFALNAINIAQSMETAEASVSGSEIVYRGGISYKAVSSAQSDKQAFANTLTMKVERMAESHARAAEMQLLYGNVGLARLTSRANVNTTTTTVTASLASWSDALWSGSRGMTVQFYANDNTTLISSGADSIFTVSSVNYATQTLTVTGTTTGITALDGATYTGGGLFVYRNGAKGVEMIGIDSILTTSGSLFGISNTTYDLWRGNQETTTGDLNMAKLQLAVNSAVGRGLQEDVTVWMSPRQWTQLTADQASLRRYDSAGGKAVNGFDSIEFFAANGKLVIEPHPMVKNGDVFILPLKKFKRIGSSDITFQRPGNKGEFFRDLEANAGYELRSYSDFALICEAPARCVKLTGFNP